MKTAKLVGGVVGALGVGSAYKYYHGNASVSAAKSSSSPAIIPVSTSIPPSVNVSSPASALSFNYSTPSFPAGSLLNVPSSTSVPSSWRPLLSQTSPDLSFFFSYTKSFLGNVVSFFASGSAASARMQERLKQHNYKENPVVPDGNCQMRAISHQMYEDENRHREVRTAVVDWLDKNEKFKLEENGNATLGDFLDRDQFPQWSSYIRYMSRNGAWGDHLTLLGAAENYGVTITVVSNVDDRGANQYMTLIRPRTKNSHRTIHLSHWHEVHYNSLSTLQPEPPDQQHAA